MIAALALLVEAASGLIIAGHAVAACRALLLGRGPDAARRVLAEGAILALSLNTAGALLRTVGDPGWEAILHLGAMLALRTGLKRAVQAERDRPSVALP